MKWKLSLVAMAVAAVVAVLMHDDAPPPVVADAASSSAPASPLTDRLPGGQVDGGASPSARGTGSAWLASQPASMQAALDDFERLRGMPAGDEAIALARRIEAGIGPGNAVAYVQALLTTDDPAVERAAAGALARGGDGAAMRSLADSYGAVQESARGRILQVLERSENPAAVEGLAAIVAADNGERRSPVTMASLYGIANSGTTDGVQYLLGQVGTDNVDYAMMALGRVTSTEGVAMIAAAAQGNKDAQGLPDGLLQALGRIAAEGAQARQEGEGESATPR